MIRDALLNGLAHLTLLALGCVIAVQVVWLTVRSEIDDEAEWVPPPVDLDFLDAQEEDRAA